MFQPVRGIEISTVISLKDVREDDMFAEYVQAALRSAKYETLEDGTYMATVSGLRGVIAIGDTVEECRDDLIGVIEGWIALRLKMGDTVPAINGIAIDVSTEPVAFV
jgi:predicted RNase H-like HicB family nuclease